MPAAMADMKLSYSPIKDCFRDTGNERLLSYMRTRVVSGGGFRLIDHPRKESISRCLVREAKIRRVYKGIDDSVGECDGVHRPTVEDPGGPEHKQRIPKAKLETR